MLAASEKRLWVGALLGVLSAPLFLVGTRDLVRGLPADGRGRTAAPVIGALLTTAHVLSPFMHGSFGPMGIAYRRAQEAENSGADQATVDALVGLGNRIQKGLTVPYAVYFTALTGASAIMTTGIARGRTTFPRWTAAVLPPIWPVIGASAATGNPRAKRTRAQVLKGAGMSLGLAASFLTSALVRRREN
jgi:hypothetical protein